MALPHYNESTASSNRYEPIQGNLFEVTLLPPGGIDGGMALEHVNTIEGLDGINPEIAPVGQKYKFADRSFAGTPDQTFVDITVNFSLNLNDANQAYLYKTLRDWYKLQYDPETGEQGLKRDYVGTIIIVEYNRAGDIYRKVTLFDAFPNAPTGLGSNDYSSAEPKTMEVVFRADHWTEELT